MGTTAIVSAILTVLAGIGIFLVACQMMSSNLESASSAKLKSLFAKASKSKLLGVGIGTVGTAAIQSSGATTVMTIGFVNAGIISLSQAATIIYGANIGTTVTAQIVALGMFGRNALSTTVIFSAFAGIGAAIMTFAKKNSIRTLGGILTGFGMLFVGLSLMSGSMEEFAALDSVKLFLSKISNPLLLVLIGTLLTAIIQSSSVMTSIALAMCVTGLISLDQGIFLTMGSNIGSCVVAIIAGMTSGTNARRTALIHLFFNCSGVIVFLTVGWLLIAISGNAFGFGSMFERMFPGVPQTQLAMFHTFFNVITVILMLPLTDALVNFVKKIVREQDDEVEALHLHYVNDNMLKAPPVAVAQTKKEVLRMAELSIENFDRSLSIITTLDFFGKEDFERVENELNFINTELVDFVVKLSYHRGLSGRDKLYLSTVYRSVRDIERIGDYAENIVEYAEDLSSASDKFSDDALYEISQLKILVHSLYDKVIAAYNQESIEELEQANAIEEQIDDFTKAMEENHIERMGKGICNANTGSHYMSLSSDTERIADHLINVAKTVTSLQNA